MSELAAADAFFGERGRRGGRRLELLVHNVDEVLLGRDLAGGNCIVHGESLMRSGWRKVASNSTWSRAAVPPPGPRRLSRRADEAADHGRARRVGGPRG